MFPEVLLLLWRDRRPVVWAASAALAAVQLALLPLAISDAGHPLSWLTAIPLGTRLQQVPMAFAANTLDRSSALGLGLPLAGLLLAVVVLLLVGGASAGELRGAALAGVLAACVLLGPLLAAGLGHDFLIVRAMIAAWVPLAIVIGAAATAERWRGAGLALPAAAGIGFVLAGIAIQGNPDYQRPNWRGVARALGTPHGTRAIVAYDGALATDPLTLYLPGVVWRQTGRQVAVSELDIVASPLQQPAPAPAGVALTGRRSVDGYVVSRFSLLGPWRGTPTELGTRAGALLAPAPAAPAVLIQPGR